MNNSDRVFRNGGYCFEEAHAVLDGMATPSQTEFFMKHAATCGRCRNNYEIDRFIQGQIRSKCNGMTPPDDWISKLIRTLNL